MKQPTVKSVKIYAVIESTIELPASELEAYLRQERFTGRQEVMYNQGGIRTVVTKEHIPMTMQQIDELLARKQSC